jgi:protein FAM161A
MASFSSFVYRSRRPPSAPTTTSWAGRVTKPEPFSLTNSMTMGNVHRKKCIHQLEEAKLQKEIDDELLLNRSFKGKYSPSSYLNDKNLFSSLATPVPAHVRMPLYEQLQEEQRARREQVRHMTKEYLNSISKPFGFDSREKAKNIVRRHSYSDGDTVRRESHFKAKPLPDFYYRTSKDIEKYDENIFLFFSSLFDLFILA